LFKNILKPIFHKLKYSLEMRSTSLACTVLHMLEGKSKPSFTTLPCQEWWGAVVWLRAEQDF